METWKILTIVMLVVVGAALVTATTYAYMGNRIGTYAPYGTNTGTTYPYTGGYGYGYGGGMMGGGMMGGGYRYYNAPPAATYPQNTVPTQPTQTTPPTTPTTPTPAAPAYPYGIYAGQLNISTAVTIAQNYLAARYNPDLAVKEIEEYSQNFYVQYYEKSTGIGAFEMLIDKYTGAISPEMGPNMMWNTKYGMMSGGGNFGGMMGGGMMGGYGYGYGYSYTGIPTATMPVNEAQAKVDAQQYLNTYYPGTTAEEVFAFYGYYHVMVQLNGSDYGMMSVNGYTGQGWYHTWHGTFIQELKVG